MCVMRGDDSSPGDDAVAFDWVEALEAAAACWPLCPAHGVALVWQESWGFPGWVCGLCMEPTSEGEA